MKSSLVNPEQMILYIILYIFWYFIRVNLNERFYYGLDLRAIGALGSSFDPGVLLLDPGILLLDPGVLLLDPEILLLDPGVAVLDSGTSLLNSDELPDLRVLV